MKIPKHWSFTILVRFVACWTLLPLIFGLAFSTRPNITEKSTQLSPGDKLPSPNGSFLLLGKVGPSVWLTDLRRHKQDFILTSEGSLFASWSPDSNYFSVRDNVSSDTTRSYIYNAQTLERLDLAEKTLEAFPGEKQFFEHAHSYVVLEGWSNKHTALASLTGHTDRDKVVCFAFRFRVVDGKFRRLSEKVGPCQ